MLRGWKEPVIFVTFGPLCVAGVVYALTGAVPAAALVASVPLGLSITAVAYLKSARFEVVDEGTEQVVLKLSRRSIMLLFAAGYLGLAGGVAVALLPPWSLAGLASVPLAFSVVSVVRGQQSRVTDYLWATVRCILVSIAMGLGLGFGEPPREFRRLFGVSHAAVAGSVSLR